MLDCKYFILKIRIFDWVLDVNEEIYGISVSYNIFGLQTFISGLQYSIQQITSEHMYLL